jgi:hypothetical protein
MGTVRSPREVATGIVGDEPAGASRRGRWPGARLLTRRQVRIALGALWLFDAALQLEPGNFDRGYPLGTLAQSVMGAPGWENHAIFTTLRPFAPHWPWWNLAAVVLQAAIGLCLVTGRAVRPALLVSFGWAAFVWFVGEGLGTLPTGFATMLTGAPGPALLYVVLGALAWPTAERSVDRRWWAAAWVALWAGTALLEIPFVFPPAQVLSAGFAETALDQRHVLVHLVDGAARVTAHAPVATAVGLAALQLAVGVGWLVDRAHPRRWLGLGIALSLAYWVFGQALGEILSPGATDPGTAPLVVLLALAAWPATAGSDRAGEEGAQHGAGALEVAAVHPLVGVVGQEGVARSEVGRRHAVGPEGRHVGPAHLGPGRTAGPRHQGGQERVVEGGGSPVGLVDDLEAVPHLPVEEPFQERV